MKRIITFYIFLCLSLVLSAQADSRTRLFILSIGVQEYIDTTSLAKLSFSAKDARDIAEAFQKQTKRYIIEKDMVKVLQNMDATPENINSAINEFLEKGLGPNDLLLFYFSGHGEANKLLLSNYKKKSVKLMPDDFISKEQLGRLLASLGCNAFVFIDACHSGSFVEGLTSKGGEEEEQKIIDSLNRETLRIFSQAQKQVHIFTSCNIKEKSYESKEYENGYFTQRVLDALENKPIPNTNPPIQSDGSGDKILVVSELQGYLGVTHENGLKQTMESKINNSSLIVGDVYMETWIKQDDDGDGIINENDSCPYKKGEKKWRGCPDEDGDGVGDDTDLCPNVKGKKDYSGCLSPPVKTYTYQEEHFGINIKMLAIKGGNYKDYNTETGKLIANDFVKDYYLGETEVTNAQWNAVMGEESNPSMFKDCNECPVDNVSKELAISFIEKLNKKSKKRYRLPTQIEWEYAARGFGNYKYCGGNKLDDVAWHYGNSEHMTHNVKGKKENEYYLYDMQGNVAEWCSDINPDTKKDILKGGCYMSMVEEHPIYSIYVSESSNPGGSSSGFRLCHSGE